MLPALLLAAAAAGSPAAPCTADLVAWTTIGEAAPGREWTARVFNVRRDRAWYQELTIRLGSGWLSPAEARWFEPPTALRPEAIFVSTTPCSGECLQELCEGLADVLAPALTGVERRCEAEKDGTAVFRDRSVLTRKGTSGYLLRRPGRSPPERCAPEGSSVELRVTTAQFEDVKTDLSGDGAPGSRAASDFLAAIERTLARLSHGRAAAETGLAGVPTAREIREDLRSLLGESYPSSLPSDMLLAAAVGPKDYVAALALERLRFGGTREPYENALALLGEVTGPGAAEALVVHLRGAVESKEAKEAGLILRALLRADRAVAREQAFPLLDEESVRRPALGIFALTDPTLEALLADVPRDDPDAIAAAVRAVRERLCRGPGDEPLRKAACGAIE